MFKEHSIFILAPIAFAPISSPIVDQDPVPTTNDEPIKDVYPIALDVAMDIPFKRLERERRPTISNDYFVYLQEHEHGVDDVSDPTTYKEAIVSPQSNFWIDATKYEMTSM